MIASFCDIIYNKKIYTTIFRFFKAKQIKTARYKNKKNQHFLKAQVNNEAKIT